MSFEWGEVISEITNMEQILDGIQREFGLTLIAEAEHTPGIAIAEVYDGEITFDLPSPFAIRLNSSTVINTSECGVIFQAYTEEIELCGLMHTGLDINITLTADGINEPVFDDENFIIAFGNMSIASDGVPANSLYIDVVPNQITLGTDGVIPPLNRILYSINQDNVDLAGATAYDLWTIMTVTFGIIKLTETQKATRIWSETNQ